MSRPLCCPDPCRDFVDDYDDTIVNCYKYEAHAKIPPQILKCMAGKTGLKVLDVGCGTGLLARPFFADSDTHEVTGIDATPEMTAAASKRASVWQLKPAVSTSTIIGK